MAAAHPGIENNFSALVVSLMRIRSLVGGAISNGIIVSLKFFYYIKIFNRESLELQREQFFYIALFF